MLTSALPAPVQTHSVTTTTIDFNASNPFASTVTASPFATTPNPFMTGNPAMTGQATSVLPGGPVYVIS